MVASISTMSSTLPYSAAPKLNTLGLEMLTPILRDLKHRYSRQILTRKSCDFCGKSMYIVGLRCKQCNLKCHRKCAMTAPPQCLLALDGHTFTNLRGRRTHNGHRSEKHDHVHSPCACAQRSRPLLHRQHSISTPDEALMSPVSPAVAATPCSCISPCITTSTPIRGTEATAFNFNMVHSTPSSPNGTQSSQTSSSSCGYYSLGSEYNISTVDSTTGTTSCTCGCQKITNRLSQSDKRTRWCGGKARTIDVTSSTNKTQVDADEMRTSLISTWPRDFFSHHQNQSNEDVPNSIEDAQRICDWMKIETTTNSSERSVREAVKEWSIPFENLKFRKRIRHGAYSNEYRGQWHGDVIIHTREVQTEEDFLEEISMLSKIRHENIALFMGACIDAPNFCVVTSIRGVSLYDRIHRASRDNRLSLNSRVHIARQIAQGMGYLHAKGIVVGCLNSKNIYLESKVKVCMTGQETVDSPCKSDTHACIPRGHITYLAPELLRRAKVTPPTLTIDTTVTQQCDIYAFGTVLYELLTQNWPFRHSSIASIIYQVSLGSRQSVSHIKCSTSLKDIITECWAHNYMERPMFSSIMKDLQDSAALVNMNRSRSEPENLNKLGVPGRLW
ncbi:kinase suppressor of Ras 2-like isoform X2 [Antedon mediterranea]|uniref:kinase suppressor of Ras 2-like isoform X2 n=1 Tax=Antedon mediterranea TaxID=105859 RepID=UPI003AF9A219